MKSIKDVIIENNFFKNLGVGRCHLSQEFVDKHERSFRQTEIDKEGNIVVTKFKDSTLCNIIYNYKNNKEELENIIFKFDGNDQLKIELERLNHKYNGLNGFIEILNNIDEYIIGLDEILVTEGFLKKYALLERHKRGGWKVKKYF